MKLPYRNVMKKTKNFKLDKDKKYFIREQIKPNTLCYQIRDSGFQWDNLEWGKHIYKLDIDINNIYTVKEKKDLIEFNNKYCKDKELKTIDWKEVSGFEIKNYKNIIKIIGIDEIYNKYPWVITF